MTRRDGQSVPRPRRLTRLAATLSLRTISGKLIVGLLILFGLASVIVSVISAQSLNNSLMSSLNQQVQAATHTWLGCVQQSTVDSAHNDPDHSDAARPDPDDYKMCSELGQAPGTFEEMLAGNSIGYKHTVQGRCPLSPADAATLASLPLGSGPAPSRPADFGGTNPPPPASAAPFTTYIRTLDSLGGKFMLTKVPGPEQGTALVTGMPLAMVDKTLERVENTEHLVFATVLLLAVLLGAGLIQFSLRPLRRVAATATKVTELPLDSGEVTLPAGVPDSDPRTEVGRLGAALNGMLTRIEAAIRERTHWNSPNLQPQDPVTLGLCSQTDLDFEVNCANKEKPAPADAGATFLAPIFDELTAVDILCRYIQAKDLPDVVVQLPRDRAPHQPDLRQGQGRAGAPGRRRR